MELREATQVNEDYSSLTIFQTKMSYSLLCFVERKFQISVTFTEFPWKDEYKNDQDL